MGKNYYPPLGDYDKARSFLPIFTVQAVINFGAAGSPKVLLLRRKEEPCRGDWYIPGGRVLKTEATRLAILRVVKKETGLRCRIVKQLPNTREIFRKVPGTADNIYDTISENFLLEPATKKIMLDKTHSDYRLVEKIEKNLHPYVKQHLKNSGLF